MKRIKLTWLLLIVVFVLLNACKKDQPTPPKPIDNTPDVVKFDPVSPTKTNTTKVWVHYMPWFETPESSKDGKWGIHWTMANKNPDKIVDAATGKREIASYYYPLIGPYATRDDNVIEYHLLLMKYAGIDGLVFDWYGNDGGEIQSTTEEIVGVNKEVGLDFGIVYEDRFVKNRVDNGQFASNNAVAKYDMVYLQNSFFNQKEYIKINTLPLLLIFGPIVIQKPSDWSDIFSVLNPKPCFLTLWYESVSDAGTNARGEYSWVYQNNAQIPNFYTNQAPKFSVAMGSAYPGFKDFYTAGGWGASATGWTIDHANGATFDELLKDASDANAQYLQLVTWNDFGEGTMIEPTNEFGYMFLEKIQKFTGVSYTKTDLENVYRQYTLRKKLAGIDKAQSSLDQSFYYFVSLQNNKAVHILDSLETAYAK